MEDGSNHVLLESPDSMEYLLRQSMVSRKKQTLISKDEDGNIVFSCVECPMKYTDKETMELHLCMHNKEYRFICIVCGTGLKRKEHLERHMLGHQEVRPHVCPECGKAFKRKEHLNIHSVIHNGQKHLQCRVCQRSFHRKDHLQKHIQCHNKKLVKSGEAPMSAREMVHIKTEADEFYAQEMLDNVYPEDALIDQACKAFVKSNDPERPFACCVCEKTFKRKDHLKLHMYTHVKKERVCEHCGKAFHKMEQLASHVREHMKTERVIKEEEEITSADGEGTWQDLALPDYQMLVPRVELGHRELPGQPLTFWCEGCRQDFLTNTEFESHDCVPPDSNQEVTEGQEDDAFYPDMEIKEEDSQCGTDESQMEFTPESYGAPAPQKIFVCKYCSKSFRRRDHFKIHLNIHTGIKRFFCSVCGKGFYRKDHMQKHVLTHSKSKNKKSVPDLFPITMMKKIFNKMPAARPAGILPEITIHAPSSASTRLLQMKVPYEVVTSSPRGETRALVQPHSA